MKTIKIIQSLALLMAVSSFLASAQPPQRLPMGPGHGEMPDKPVRMSAKEKAERRTDKMHETVNLTEKQYKKIYKIYLKEENAKEAAMNGPMGMPPGGFPGGGFPGGPGGFPDGGFPGGPGDPGAGGPPAGMTFPDGFGASKATVGGKEIDSDEYIDESEAKFQKILTPEQYAAWRAKNPDPTGYFIK